MHVDIMPPTDQGMPGRLPLRVTDKKVIGTVAAHHQHAYVGCRQQPRDLGGNSDRAQWNIRVNAKTGPVVPGMASCVRNRDQDRMVTLERAGECAIHHHGPQGLKVLTANKSIRRHMLLESQSAPLLKRPRLQELPTFGGRYTLSAAQPRNDYLNPASCSISEKMTE